ncbi:MAG TPA: hypothetical protein VM536_12470, partial [Chloroflexia bacterium]|nr:hypothetical protein [Chloroflexia bacterium]
VWSDAAGNSISRFDLATRTSGVLRRLPNDPNTVLDLVGLGGGTVYFNELSAGHRGLYAMPAVGGAEMLITALSAQAPVAGDDKLLWLEQLTGPSKNVPPTFALHLHMQDGTANDHVIPTGGAFSSHQVSGNTVIWISGVTGALMAYDIPTGSVRAVAPASVIDPQLHGSHVAWTEAARRDTFGTTIRSLDLTTGAVTTVGGGQPGLVRVAGITDNGLLAYTVGYAGTPGGALYVTPLP